MGDPDKGKNQYPVEDRSCTDILCCLLFIACIILGFIVAITGFSQGNIPMLTSAFDSSGFPCGQSGSINGTVYDLKSKPLLYFSTPYGENIFPYKTTCVSKCPDSDSFQVPTDWCNTVGNVNVTSCSQNCDAVALGAAAAAYELNNKNNTNKNTLANNSIMCIYKSSNFVDRICLPDLNSQLITENAKSAYKKYVNSEAVMKWVDSVKATWVVILISFLIAFFVGCFYMVIVRYFAGVVVWVSILAYIVLLALLGVYFNKKADEYQTLKDSSNDKSMRYLSYLIWAITAASIILIFFMYNRIRLAIAVIKTAALYVKDVPHAMLVPIITSFAVIAWIIIWIVCFVYILATFDSVKKDDATPFANITYSDKQSVSQWYWLFFGLWVNAFIQALEQFVLVGSVCIWYFSQGSGVIHSPIIRPFKWGIFYHLGSLAFGSFILAVVQLIRIILAYIEQQAKKTGASQNKAVMCLIKCLQCYAACFERFIKFLNRNAYIQIALKGKNFCESAKDAVGILWNNAARASIVQSLGGIFIVIGELFICLVTLFICYLILTGVTPYKSYSPWLSLIIILIIAFTIGILFMSVYGMAMDTIFICFCEDEKTNKDSKPKHCPNLLQEFLDNDVKKEQDKKPLEKK